jgi:peptidoglycan/LPS O-acetylase OafA/YrhL
MDAAASSSVEASEVAPASGATRAPAKSRLAKFLELELLDNRYPALHGLRFLAIISVVQFHVTWIYAGEQRIILDPEWVGSSLAVFFGMDLFFMLSGFLIGSILLRSLETSGTQKIRRFYVRRVFRTFPSYYVVLTFLVATTALTAAQWKHLPAEYLYATNFMPLGRDEIIMFWGWSLALEEQFYLTVPILFFVLHRMTSERLPWARALRAEHLPWARALRAEHLRLALLVAMWLAALVLRIVIYLRHRPWTDLALYDALYFRTPTRFDTLVAGIILAYVQHTWAKPIGAWLSKPFHRALVAMPSLLCLWFLMNPTIFGIENLQKVHLFTWGSVTTLMYFGWLLLLLHGDGWVHRALSWPFFRRAATLGYGVYLVHIPLIDHALVPIAHAAQARKISMILVWPLSLAAVMIASLLLGYVMHVLIEKPSLAFRDKLAG